MFKKACKICVELRQISWTKVGNSSGKFMRNHMARILRANYYKAELHRKWTVKMKSSHYDKTGFIISDEDRELHLKKTDNFKKIEIYCPICKKKESYLISPSFLHAQQQIASGPIRLTLFSASQSPHKISFNIDQDMVVGIS